MFNSVMLCTVATRLPYPWDSLDENGMGCHALFPQYVIQNNNYDDENYDIQRYNIIMT